MRFEKLSGAHKVMNVERAGSALKWEYAGATHFVVIRGRYGAELDCSPGGAFAQALAASEAQLLSRGSAAADGRDVRLVPLETYMREKRYILGGDQPTPARFVVLAAEVSQGSSVVYLPNYEGELYFRDAQKDVRVSRKAQTEGLFSKKLTGIYEIMVEMIAGYSGGLYYKVDGMDAEYPITAPMLNNLFIVKRCPNIGTHDKGFNLIITNG